MPFDKALAMPTHKATAATSMSSINPSENPATTNHECRSKRKEAGHYSGLSMRTTRLAKLLLSHTRKLHFCTNDK